MKTLILFFVLFCSIAFGQADTLYLRDSLIYLSNGEILQPGLLPVSTPSISYTYTKVQDDNDLLLMEAKLKDESSIIGFYRKVKIKASNGTFFDSWEQDLLWITIDSNNQLVDRTLYSNGTLIKDKSVVHVTYR